MELNKIHVLEITNFQTHATRLILNRTRLLAGDRRTILRLEMELEPRDLNYGPIFCSNYAIGVSDVPFSLLNKKAIVQKFLQH